jgi:hypothetical protein
MSRGTSTGADNVFCLHEAPGVGGLSTRTGLPVEIERDILRKPIYASDFGRFSFRPKNAEFLIFPYEVQEKGYRLLGEQELREQYPNAYHYLRNNRHLLEQRKQYQAWYGFSAARNLDVHLRANLLVPLLADRGLFSPMPRQPERYCLMASGGFSVGIGPETEGVHPYFVLGLLNSQLLFWNLRLISNKFRGGWITCTKQYFGTLPIKVPLSDSSHRQKHDQVIALVEHIVALREKLSQCLVGHERDLLEGEVEATERQLNRVVYELYGLGEAEIDLVEGWTF